MEAVSRRAWVLWLVVVSSGYAAVLASLIEGARLVQRDDGGPAVTAWLLVLAGTLAQSYRVPIPNPRLPLGAFIAARYETGSPDRRTGAAVIVPAARETLSLVGAVHAFALLALWP